MGGWWCGPVCRSWIGSREETLNTSAEPEILPKYPVIQLYRNIWTHSCSNTAAQQNTKKVRKNPEEPVCEVTRRGRTFGLRTSCCSSKCSSATEFDSELLTKICRQGYKEVPLQSVPHVNTHSNISSGRSTDTTCSRKTVMTFTSLKNPPFYLNTGRPPGRYRKKHGKNGIRKIFMPLKIEKNVSKQIFQFPVLH